MNRDGARVAVAFGAIYLIWGTTYLALRYAVEAVPPLLTIAVRCVAGALVLGLWLTWRGQLVRPTARQWGAAAAAGTLLFLGGHAVLAWAEQRVPSGRAALLLATTPLWFTALESVRTRRRPARRAVLGLAAAIAGLAVLGLGATATAGSPADHLLLLGSALAWAVGSLIAREQLSELSAMQSTTMQLGAGAAAVVAASLAVGEPGTWRPEAVTPLATGAVAFLVVGGTIIGFAAYTWLLRRRSAEAVGTYAFVNPVVALLLAWAVGDERATPASGAAAALIIGAVMVLRMPTGGLRGAIAAMRAYRAAPVRAQVVSTTLTHSSCLSPKI